MCISNPNTQNTHPGHIKYPQDVCLGILQMLLDTSYLHCKQPSLSLRALEVLTKVQLEVVLPTEDLLAHRAAVLLRLDVLVENMALTVTLDTVSTGTVWTLELFIRTTQQQGHL